MINKERPLISIIIPTFNRQDLIGETLDSILKQIYTNWECIIVDDGSSDKTKTIVNSYIGRDSRIKFYSRPSYKPKGANACRNYGLEVCKGKYVVFLDSDDLITSEKLQIQVKILEEHTSKVACISQSDCFSGVNKIIKRQFGQVELDKETTLIDLITKKVHWQTAAGLWVKKDLAKKPFDEFIYGGQDWCFHIKQAVRNDISSFVILNVPTVLVRLDNESISRSKSDFLYTYQRAESRLQALKILKKESASETVIKAVKIEFVKKVIRLLPFSKKRRKRFYALLRYSNRSGKEYLFSIVYFISLGVMSLNRTNSRLVNNIIIMFSKIRLAGKKLLKV